MRRDELSVLSPSPPASRESEEIARRAPMPWIQIASGGSYFQTDAGEAWTPIGQNDSISWVEFNGLFRRKNVPLVEDHIRWLKAHGVTCLRFMLEYSQVRNRIYRHLERPMGTYSPNMVQLWDDLFALCEAHGMRILLTPYDTFWMWIHWKHHPYNVANGGCLDRPSRMLLDPEMRKAIKARFEFAIRRWGGSGALFAWDLWNEIHPAHAQDSADCFGAFIADIGQHVRSLEEHLYGRSHLQTVSLFGPELRWKAHMPLVEPIFQHPDLDFATIHIYEERTIDDPRDTIAPALGMGRIVRESLAHTQDGRPFLDSEHGPIHAFKYKHKTFAETFDDEYFRHMQWAHFASGAAGGGMRWPNRRPHVLTKGMRQAQRALADFLPLLDWNSFRRQNLNQEITASGATLACFGCGDTQQALVWLLRRDTLGADGRVDRGAASVVAKLSLPGLLAGNYQVTGWNTLAGTEQGRFAVQHPGGPLEIETPAFAADIALAVRGIR